MNNCKRTARLAIAATAAAVLALAPPASAGACTGPLNCPGTPPPCHGPLFCPTPCSGPLNCPVPAHHRHRHHRGAE